MACAMAQMGRSLYGVCNRTQVKAQALEHGKHVLVEKSITLNSGELEELSALAAEKKLVLAEAMTIWHMPVYKRL